MASASLSKHRHMTCGLPFTQVITEKRGAGYQETEVFLACAYCHISHTKTVMDMFTNGIKYDISYVVDELAYTINAISSGCMPREGMEYAVKQLTGVGEWMREQAIMPIGEFMAYDPSQNDRLRYADPINAVICRLCKAIGTIDTLEHRKNCDIELLEGILRVMGTFRDQCSMDGKIQWFKRMRGQWEVQK